MSAWLLLLLIAALIAGVVLVWFGLRGRRINRDPVCRDCGFNLGAFRLPEMHGWKAATVARNETPESATQPITVTCPECGGGLKRAKAVRVGERRRMPIATVFGILLVAFAAIPVGAVFVTTMTGSDLSKALPTGVLIWQSRHASREVSKSIALELEDRIIKKTLGDEQVLQVVERALDIQSDWKLPWMEEWGRVVSASELYKPLTPDQRARWISNAAKIELVARENVRPGDPLPIRARLLESRLSPKETMHLRFAVEELRINETIVRERSELEKPIGSNRKADAELMVIAMGSESPDRNSYINAAVPVTFIVPRELAPGEHEFVARVKPITWDSNGQKEGGVRELRATLKVANAEAEAIEQVRPTEQQVRAITASLAQNEPVWRGFPETKRNSKDGKVEVTRIRWMLEGLNANLRMGDPSVGFHMRVFAIGVDGKETQIGTLTSEPYEPDNPSRFGSDRIRWNSAIQPEPFGAPLELVLRPDIDGAMGTFTLRKIYMGELRVTFPTVQFRDVRGATFPSKEQAVERIKQLR